MELMFDGGRGGTDHLLDQVLPTATAAIEALRADVVAGAKVLVAGNGGSASQASHFAAELLGRYTSDRRPIPALNLAADTAVLTAIANDVGFDQVFSRQIEALADSNDVVVLLSTSGRSPNILEAARRASDQGCTTIALTGSGAKGLGDLVDHHVAVDSQVVSIIQEVHMTLLHGFAGVLEHAVS